MNKPLVVIAGPTASGKTSLSVNLAKKFNGEIICADSRTIYKYMDIGTAKPTQIEQSSVPHWGVDLIEPGERFSVADFKTYADQKIKEIRDRNHIPFLVGGTGLYVDAVIFDYQFCQKSDDGMRCKLQQMSLAELYEYSIKNNIKLPENYKNKRYVIRAIERLGAENIKNTTPLDNSIIVGISTDKLVLRSRIQQRSEQIFNDGVIEEAISLSNSYGWSSEAMTSNIYPIIHQYLDGNITLAEAKEKFATQDWHLAKRQMTWLKRNSFIKWLLLDEAEKYLSDRLAIYR
jgi:tRNA dimethylallyltransferase